MATSNIEKVLTVFQGIGNRDPDLAAKYIHPQKYIEHNPFAADGVNGMKAYIASFPGENHHLKVVRTFQDDSYVFTQQDGEILGQNTFFDVFRFEDGLIVEHWSFSAKAGPPNKSGHTQVDGPTEVRLDEHTEKNKSLVRDYYQSFHIEGRQDVIPRYFAGDVCVRHEPGVADGVPAFLHDLETMARNRTIDEIKLLLGQGDFVFLAAQGTHHGEPCVYIDLYRVERGKIVEHWGFPEHIPPAEEWKNGNGIL